MSNTGTGPADIAPPLPPPTGPGVVADDREKLTEEGPVVIKKGKAFWAPFRVTVDDREKKPYLFRSVRGDVREGGGILRVESVVSHMPTGDYSIEGFESRVAVERKEIGDLFSTLGSNRARFQRELERLAVLEFAAVVIEAEWSEVLGFPPSRSSLPPKTVIRSVMAWQVRFPRVHWWTVPGRSVGEAVTFRILDRFYREHEASK